MVEGEDIARVEQHAADIAAVLENSLR